MRRITAKKAAALFAVVVLTAAERDYLTAVVCAMCEGKPLCERVTLAAEITDRAEHEDIADAVLSVLGNKPELNKVAGVDKESEEYRLSLDAVDAALGGCRGKG